MIYVRGGGMAKDYAVSPGEYLQEWLEESGMTQSELASRLGVSRKLVNGIVRGADPVSVDTATRLGRVTNIPRESWDTFERAYRLDLARLQDERNLAQHYAEIDPQAFAYLRACGATRATKRDPGKLVSDFLSFHRCGTWEAYVESVSDLSDGEYALASLKEHRSDVDSTLLTTWLAAGEMTETFETRPRTGYSSTLLRAALPALRDRCASPDQHMLSDAARQLAQVGVCLLKVDPPKGLPLFGVTRWIDQHPVVQQSGRRQTDGFVIWTLFHELGHVLNDPRGEMHVEFSTRKKRTSAAEKGANGFAREVLFGERGIERVRGLTKDGEIRAAARELGISAGVIVHHLHRTRQLDYSHGNRLVVNLGDSASN